MSQAGSDSEVVVELAEEFIDRYRGGERPPLGEYTSRYPHLKARIEDVFPAMAMMENIAILDSPGDGSASFDKDLSPSHPPSIGDYRIIREVGRGGMGIVYEAEQLSLGRRVALKVLPQQMLLDKKHKRRFEREAKAAAKLHHTNIVPVFGVGGQDGLHYYVMQFIQGLGLDEVIGELQRIRDASLAGKAVSQGELRVAPRGGDISAGKVARSLMTGEFEPTVVTGDGEAAREESGRLRSTAGGERPGTGDGTNGPAAQLEVHQSGAEPVPMRLESSGHRETSGGKLSDSFTLSGSFALPGQSDASDSTSGSRARRKQTFWTSVAHIGQQVASALQYAHEQGITHRDIKPSNLLLDMQGTVWVTDFGLAKGSDQQDITHTGDILGTLRYMPPEAFEGRSDARGDQYSLGLTLYELLTQRPAFGEKDRHKLIKLVTTTEPTRIEKLNPDVPRDLATIVHKAIDRDPSHRYASAREFADDLQRFLADEPIRARRFSMVERLARWSRRNRGLAASLAAVCLLLLVINIVGPVMTWRLAKLNIALKERQTQLDSETARANHEADTVRAFRAFANLLEKSSGFAARSEMVDQLDESQMDLEGLLKLRPKDPSLWRVLSRRQAAAGQTEAAAESLSRARQLAEELLAEQVRAEAPVDEGLLDFLIDLLLYGSKPPVHWAVLEPTDCRAESGTTLTRRDDGSIVASEQPLQNETYRITGHTDLTRISALRLDALTDQSIIGSGPGWGAGNFDLTELRVLLQRTGRAAARLSLRNAVADYTRPHQAGAVVLDDDHSTHWDIWPRPGQQHWLVLHLTEPTELAKGDRVIVEMDFRDPRFPAAKLGCFRLSVTNDPTAFDAHQQRAMVSGYEPYLRLGAAYTAVGDSIKAAEWNARALDQAAGFAARRELVEQIDELHSDLSQLLTRRPDDPLVCWAQARRQIAVSNSDAAAELTTRARSLMEDLLAASPDDETLAGFLADLLLAELQPSVSWAPLPQPHVESDQGEQFAIEDDGSIFVSGPNPQRAVYHVHARSPLPTVSCLRIETLPDARLPHAGAGRYPENGNFLLSEVTLAVESTESPGSPAPVNIAGIVADALKSAEFAPRNMIDGNPRTAWDVWPRQAERHAAIIQLKTPVQCEGGELLITLDGGINSFGRHGLGRFRISVTDDPTAFDTCERNFAPRRIEDPWERLGAAYAMDGDAPGAAKCFARLMDRTPDFAARLKLAEQIQKGSTDLADLEVLRPDDPVFEWLRWRRKFRESADTTNVGQPVEGFLEYLEQTREIDLRMLYDVPEFHSVVEQAGFEQLLEARLAQSTPSVRQQVWTKQPPQPFAAQLQRSRDGITELIAKLDSEGLCPVFLGTSPLSINSVPNFVVRWTSDPRDHRLRLKLTRQQLDELLKTPSEGMELVSLEEYRDGKETLYAALWVKQVTAAPWGLHERLNESATRQLAASMRERGFRPTYVNAYPDGTFTTVWVRDDGRSELLLGLTYQDLMDLQQRRAADCLPTGIDSHFDGRRRRYCVIVDSSIKGVEWKFTLLTRDSEIQSVSNGNFEAGWKMLATTDAPVGSAMAGAH